MMCSGAGIGCAGGGEGVGLGFDSLARGAASSELESSASVIRTKHARHFNTGPSRVTAEIAQS